MWDFAVDHGLTFYRTPSEIDKAVADGKLVQLTGDSTYELSRGVGFSYATKEARQFVLAFAPQFAACGTPLMVTGAALRGRQPRNPTRTPCTRRASPSTPAAARRWLPALAARCVGGARGSGYVRRRKSVIRCMCTSRCSPFQARSLHASPGNAGSPAARWECRRVAAAGGHVSNPPERERCGERRGRRPIRCSTYRVRDGDTSGRSLAERRQCARPRTRQQISAPRCAPASCCESRGRAATARISRAAVSAPARWDRARVRRPRGSAHSCNYHVRVRLRQPEVDARLPGRAPLAPRLARASTRILPSRRSAPRSACRGPPVTATSANARIGAAGSSTTRRSRGGDSAPRSAQPTSAGE